jgi:hypothetical protein
MNARQEILWTAAPGGHGVRTVVLDRNAAGEYLSDHCWGACECGEPFMGENEHDLAAKVHNHYADALT